MLAVYRVMLASTFCVHLGGDTPTRKSFVDAVVAGWCDPSRLWDGMGWDGMGWDGMGWGGVGWGGMAWGYMGW